MEKDDEKGVATQGCIVFISYARRDGTQLAERLYEALRLNGIEAWMDRFEIRGGVDWGREIENAISGCTIELALLTEGSYTSDTCRAEQLMCLDLGKQVIPLLAQDNVRRPLHLYVKHYFDFSDPALLADHDLFNARFTGLVELLKNRDVSSVSEHCTQPQQYASTRKRFNMAPSLPRHYIFRSEEIERLRITLLAEDSDRRVAITALQGMGGIGKSVLAAALCHDKLIEAAFPDGVLWVTFGRDSCNLIDQLKAAGDRLADSTAYYSTVEQAAQRLRHLLPEKSVLLVLDDVWFGAQIDPFLMDAPRCKFLVTTRNSNIALNYAANEHSLGVLTLEQASAMLEKWSGRQDLELQTAATRLGCLPLALKIAGAQMRGGVSTADWLNDFPKVSQIRLGRAAQSSQENLEVCFELSTNSLPESDSFRFFELGMFQEDIAIPTNVITKLWQYIDNSLTAFECKDILNNLWRSALIEQDANHQTVTLHDLLHSYCQQKLGTNQYLNAQHALLLAYNPSRSDWNIIEDDGYLYDYLCYHLVHARALNELQQLFADQRWMNVRVPLQGWTYTGYVADVMLAWHKVAQDVLYKQLNAGEYPSAFENYSRYALIRTSINSLSANYTPNTIMCLMEQGHWSPERALSIAELIPDLKQKISVYSAIFKTGKLDAAQYYRAANAALQAAIQIVNEDERSYALVELANFLHSGAWQRVAIAAARAMEDQRHMVAVIVALSAQIQDDLVEQVMSTANHIDEPEYRSEIFTTLIPRLNEDKRKDVIQYVLKVSETLRSVHLTAKVLLAVVPYLEGQERCDVLVQAMQCAMAMGDEPRRVEILIALKQQCMGTEHELLIQKALDTAYERQSDDNWGVTLARFAPGTIDELRKQSLSKTTQAALRISDIRSWAAIISTFVPHLTLAVRELVLKQAMQAVLKASNEYAQAEALALFVPLLNDELLQQALEMSYQMQNSACKAKALTALGALTTGNAREEALQQAFISALSVSNRQSRVEILTSLGVLLQLEERERALHRALEATLAIESGRCRVRAFGIIGPQLEGMLLQQASQAAIAILDDRCRAESLAALAFKKSGPLYEQLLEHARQSAIAVVDQTDKAYALAAVVQVCSGEVRRELFEQAFEAALTIPKGSSQAKFLKALISQYSDPIPEPVLQQALQIAMGIDDERDRAEVLVVLARWLEGERLVHAVHAAEEIEDKYCQVMLLAALEERLPEHERDQVLLLSLKAAREVHSEELRAKALALLAPRMSKASDLRDLRISYAACLKDVSTCARSSALRILQHASSIFPPPEYQSLLDSVALVTTDICCNWIWI